mmetsp:Transcript_7947/g.7033  ORF Transcript_7947/g.7033 Transcript_7947/m.7033 type:complete len:101 (+) Transcript_7947:533-835(+)
MYKDLEETSFEKIKEIFPYLEKLEISLIQANLADAFIRDYSMQPFYSYFPTSIFKDVFICSNVDAFFFENDKIQGYKIDNIEYLKEEGNYVIIREEENKT